MILITMKKKITSKVKLILYKTMLNILLNGTTEGTTRIPFRPDDSVGLCYLLARAKYEEEEELHDLGFDGCFIEDLPEIMEYKPIFFEDDIYWFNRKNREVRRDILEKVIAKVEEQMQPHYKVKKFFKKIFGN